MMMWLMICHSIHINLANREKKQQSNHEIKKCSKHIIRKLVRRIHFHQFRVRIVTHDVFDALVGNLKILKSQKVFNYQIKDHSPYFIGLGFLITK